MRCLRFLEIGYFFLLFVAFMIHKDSRTGPVTVYGHSLAAFFPGCFVYVPYHFLFDIGRDIHGNADGMVDPFLYGSLHLDLGHPVNIVGRSTEERRFFNQILQFLLVHAGNFFGIVTVDLKPGNELMMEHIVFFPGIPYFVFEGDLDVPVVWVHLAAALV